MRNIWIIARRDLGAFFNMPLGYVVLTSFLIATGYLFWPQTLANNEASMRVFFETCPLLLAFLAPLVTMRLVAEEKRSRTIEMLVTLPITDWQILWGKFIAGFAVVAFALLLTLSYAVTLATIGSIDWGTVFAGYLGGLLLAAALVAVGLMASSWTTSQTLAAITGSALCFGLVLLGKLVPFSPHPIGLVLAYLSPETHFSSIARGILDSRDAVYYASVTGGCLFLAARSLERRRWG